MDGRTISFDEAMGGTIAPGDRSGAKPVETISSREALLRQQSGGYSSDGTPAPRVAVVDTQSNDPTPGKFPPSGTVISLEQALGAKPETPLANKVETKNGQPAIVEGAKSIWDRFVGHLDQAREESFGQFAQAGIDFDASARDPIRGMKSAGEGLLALAGFVWGQTGGAAYKTAVGDPLIAVSKRIPAADDLHPIDTKTHQFKTTGEGFSVNREDIDRTTASVNDFLETLSGFAGPAGVARVKPGALEALTPEARAAFKARETSAPAHLEGAFDTLIAKSPEGAAQVATKVGEVSPETAKYLHDRIKQFTDASEEELGLIGRRAAEANIADLEGSMPKDYTQFIDPERVGTGEGKEPGASRKGKRASGQGSLMPAVERDALGTPLNEPAAAPPARVPLVTNEQVGASLRVASQELYQGLLDDPYRYGGVEMRQPKEVRAIQREGVAEMRRRGDAPGDDFANELTSISQHYASIDRGMYVHFSELEQSKQPTTSHELLDRMVKHAEGPFQKELIQKLRTKVGNTEVYFEDAVQNAEGKVIAGTYKHSTGVIKVGMNHNYQTGTLLHELVHAGTVKFLVDNPAHPLTQELTRLYELTKSRIAEARLDLAKSGATKIAKDPYGMKDRFEFVAEAMTNKKFQDFLARSERYSKETDNLRTIYDKFIDLVTKIFGIERPETAALLRNVLDVSGKIIDQEAGTQVFSAQAEAASAAKLEGAFTRVSKNPAIAMSTGKLAAYYDEILQTFNPEGRGTRGKDAGAVIASNLAKQMQKDTWMTNRARERLAYWDKRPALAAEFIRGFEKGKAFADPIMQKAAGVYREWSQAILAQDRANGINYDPVDHYLPHIFENEKGVQEWLTRKYGPSWTEPGFAKDRGFNLYEEAEKAGFKPRFKNPEDIMLARQHSSDIAEAKVNILKDLERYGMAVKKTKDGKVPEDWQSPMSRPSPSGESYWVRNEAAGILHNVYDSTSLWNLKGIRGDIFRTGMYLKNALIPVKLAFSLFHPLHVATIDNVTGVVRATKEMLAGKTNPVEGMATILKNGSYYHTLKETVGSLPGADIAGSGNRMLRVMQGKIPDAKLTAGDRQLMQYMNDGGFIPSISSQYKLGAIENLQRALNQRSARAIWHIPGAMIQGLGKPIFEHWIPSLKTASYAADVKTALKTDPTLIDDALKRQIAFRKIAKSVDNRYGEMQYGTLFWNRAVKDIGVLNTLSMGWQLGFIREYGGGMLDAGQALDPRTGGLARKASEGKLDRPLFVTYYTTQALLYGGLMTYWMTGKSPEKWEDYIYPQTGETDEKGKPVRTSTFFYTREFGSIYKHMQIDGPGAAVADVVSSKASGMIGLATQAITGVNNFGDQIRDPNGRVYTKIEQTVAAALADAEPISMSALENGSNPLKADWWNTQFATKKGVMAKVGLSKAPKYVSESVIEGKIDSIYSREYAPKQTAFDRAEQSKEARQLRQMHVEGDTDGFAEKLGEMKEKYELTAKQIKTLTTGIRKNEDPSIKKFEKFSPAEQRHLLDEMTEDERQVYLRHSNKAQVRHKYVAPEDRQ